MSVGTSVYFGYLGPQGVFPIVDSRSGYNTRDWCIFMDDDETTGTTPLGTVMGSHRALGRSIFDATIRIDSNPCWESVAPAHFGIQLEGVADGLGNIIRPFND